MSEERSPSWVDQTAESIVDGKPIDWASLDLEDADPGIAELKRGLKRLAALEERFRSGREHGDGATQDLATWGPLQLRSELGRGSYGAVFEAFDPALQRVVALKLLHPELERQAKQGTVPNRPRDLLAEAQRLASIRHPNVLTVYGAAVHGGAAGYWSDLIDGPTLERVVRERTSLGESEAIAIGLELTSALAAVHSTGIVHGDVKPANVVRSKTGQHVLLDFGASLFEDVESPHAATPATSAPETLMEGRSTRASDIYSLGALLFHLVTGRFPVQGTTLAEVRRAHSERSRSFLADLRPDLSAEFVSTVERALSFQPSDRFASCGELHTALGRCIAGTGEPGGSISIAPGSRVASDETASGDRPRGDRSGTSDGNRDRNREGSRGATGEWTSETTNQGTSEGTSEATREETSDRIGERTGLRQLRRLWIPATVLLVGAGVLLFGREIGRQDGSVASLPEPGPRIAVVPFANLADPADESRYGEIVPSLIRTDLSESRFLSLVSSQRVFGLVERIAGDRRPIDPGRCLRVAEEANAAWMLSGEVLQELPYLIVTAELVDVETGDVIASDRVEGLPEEGVFALVDRLTASLRTRMPLPEQAHEEYDPPIESVTTWSAEAFRQYREGLEDYYRYYRDDARSHFLQAVSIDTTFAAAYLALAIAEGNPEGRPFIEAAKRHMSHVSWREQQSILGFDLETKNRFEEAIRTYEGILERYPEDIETLRSLAFSQRSIGRPEESLRAWERIREIDPRDKEAVNQIAYQSLRLGRMDEALASAEEYLLLDPESANPYDTRGDVLVKLGRTEDALEMYRRATEIRPSFWQSRAKWAALCVRLHRWDEADSLMSWAAENGSEREKSVARLDLALAAAYRGRFAEALRVLERGIREDRMDATFEPIGLKLWTRAELLEVLGKMEASEATLDEWTAEAKKRDHRYAFALEAKAEFLIRSGKRAEADSIAAELGQIVASDPEMRVYYLGVLAWLEREQGNLDSATDILIEMDAEWPEFYTAYHTGRFLLEQGRTADAVPYLERARHETTRLSQPFLAVYLELLLGRAYESLGRNEEAGRAYAYLLETWEGADDIPNVSVAKAEAKRRLQAIAFD
ncbi:MAG: protein kinase [Candidatus Eisenbacteria bacterium]|uniref:Protein kinase n=1 Tax=Eiseniibacteriota bacterium TaxID=2212470 RepID=A0A956NJS9_UNCEI|nr:protein kinase [Candidatus Eisenbacteria bacterium]